jgi:phosphatidylinositol alpha 1,6-mannosyltransferase
MFQEFRWIFLNLPSEYLFLPYKLPMRVLISAESFLPRSNGVTNSVLRVARYLILRGHEVLLIASGEGPDVVGEIQVRRVPALALKRIAQVDIPRVKVKTLMPILEEFKPDVIYLASPFLLGEQVRKAAVRAGIPTIANYQTDVSGFIEFYGLTGAKSFVEKRIRKIHNGSTLTLAPSQSSISYLKSLGVENIDFWGRGVDLKQFSPEWRKKKLRKSWGADEETIVIGFVGRLAPEKQVHKLGTLADVGNLAGKRIVQVIVGDGPSRNALETSLPNAIFTGHLSGEALSKAVASMDLLVTTGENETFCQVIQEAMASGLPVVAPAIGGPLDLISDGVDGFLYKPGPGSDIRRKVLSAIYHDENRKIMSQNALARVQSKTWENICQLLLNIMEDVAEESSDSRLKEIAAS